jgi:hypothetical protein
MLSRLLAKPVDNPQKNTFAMFGKPTIAGANIGIATTV